MFFKRVSLLLLCLLLVGLCTVNTAQATSSAPILRLSINDKVSQIDAVSKNNTFYVPVRELSEALHLEMSGTVHILTVKGTQGWITIYKEENKAMMSDGSKVTVHPFNRNGKLMIPVRIVSSYFGYSIAYDSHNHLLRIKDVTAKLSDAEFVAKFSANLKPKVSVTPTPKPASSTGKVVYLTFDDGPSASTGELLNILGKNGAKATFFMLGNNVQKYPTAVKRISSEGHAIGLHGVTHVQDKFYKSPATALAEMDKDNQYIKRITGVSSTLIRPPYGSKPYFTQPYRDKVLNQGYHLWDWNVDSMDWKYKEDTDSTYNTVMNQIHTLQKQKSTPIVLMHDQKTTLKVLPLIISSLKKEGYSFKTITKDMSPVNFWGDKR